SKRGASGGDGDRFDRAEIAQELAPSRPPNCRGCGAVLYSEVISFRAIMEPKKTPHARLEGVKVQSAHMSFAIMDEKQCSDRALEAICVQGLRRYWGSHRHSPYWWCMSSPWQLACPRSTDAGPHRLSTAAKLRPLRSPQRCWAGLPGIELMPVKARYPLPERRPAHAGHAWRCTVQSIPRCRGSSEVWLSRPLKSGWD